MALAYAPGTGKEPGAVVLYDVQDPTHPKAMCTLGRASRPEFISGSEISYVVSDGASSSIVRRTLGASGGARVVLSQAGIGGVFAPYAWTPEGKSLVFIVDSGSHHQLWIKQGATGPVALTPEMPVAARGLGPFDHVTVAISRSGNYVVMVDTLRHETTPPNPEVSQFQVMHLPDGARSLIEGGSSGPGMAVWNRVFTKLWYRDTQGIKLWNPGAASSSKDLIGPNIFWFDPNASPDGHNVAYTVLDSAGSPRINVLNEQGQVQRLPAANRSHPFYVSPQTLWYYEEAACTAMCRARIQPPSGTAFSYDLLTGKETRLPIGAVFDYWPRLTSN